MTFYAIAYRYGRRMRNDDGSPIGLPVWFATAAARDAWCDLGPDYVNEPGFREPLSPDAPECAAAVPAYDFAALWGQS